MLINFIGAFMKEINLQNHKLISFILLFGWIFLSGFSIFPLEVFPLYYPKLLREIYGEFLARNEN